MTDDVAVVIDAAETASFDAAPDTAECADCDAEAAIRADMAGRAGAPGQETADDGFTTNYDHLFGPTVARSVEDAAVRSMTTAQPVQPGVPGAMRAPAAAHAAGGRAIAEERGGGPQRGIPCAERRRAVAARRPAD